MAKICPLFSGSTGNATYISCEAGSFLVDAGSNLKWITNGISACGGNIEDLKAIFITHEHIDHISALFSITKKYNFPIVASRKTLEAIIKANKIPSASRLIAIDQTKYSLPGIEIKRFATSHDCEGSSGFTFTLPGDKKVGICTDTGCIDEVTLNHLKGCTAVLLESNHDITMLKNGPYSPMLKHRILSDRGHLSNIQCACTLMELYKSGTRRFILGHISQKNNTPALALEANKSALLSIGAKENKDYIIYAAAPNNNEVTVI